MSDCPTPKRASYATEGAAWGVIARGNLIGIDAAYRCRGCLGWHIAPRDEALRLRGVGR
jgi:hypothetical protein